MTCPNCDNSFAAVCPKYKSIGKEQVDSRTSEELVRVLRVIEYTGPRALVEAQVERSLHGTKRLTNGVTIKAATIGEYPELLADLEGVVQFPEGPYPEHRPFGHTVLYSSDEE